MFKFKQIILQRQNVKDILKETQHKLKVKLFDNNTC